MSIQNVKSFLKERFGKPFRKRRKLGEDEDDWCDALNHLSVDSDEEYSDALEQQVDSKSLHTGTKRKKSQVQKPSEQKIEEKSKMYRPTLRPHKPSTQQRQHSQGHSNISRQTSQRTDFSAASTSTPQKAYQFGDGGSNTAFSSSSGADAPAGLKPLPPIDDQPQRQFPMTCYKDEGGIPESKLEKLAKALLSEEYRNVRLLGQKLGFSLTEVYGYCPYVKPNDSSGIFRMLRAWKSKTSDAKQMQCLLEALKKANLKHLAGDLDLQEGAEEQRGAVQTSDGDSVTSPSKAIQPTTTKSDILTDNPKSSPSVVPGAGPDPNNEDAPRKGSGKTDEEKSNEPQIAGSSSEPKYTKPETVLPGAGPVTATKSASGNYSGQTDKEEKGDPQKTDSSSKPNKTNPKTVLSGAGPDPHTERATRERSGKTDGEKEREPQKNESSSKPNKTNPKTVELDAGVTVEDVIKERPVSISVCTSAYDFNVQGLVYFLKDLKEHHPELIKEVKVHALPYNDLDHYKFPKGSPVDVMLLCHSINNRRFAITDVMDALYDVYLPYCARVVGKNKMGVIVHDFDDIRPIVQSSRMGSFKYKQPKAFETTSLQITCGHIKEKQQVLKEMQKADREKLLEFLKNASNFPAEMMEQVTESKGIFTKGKDLLDTFQQRASSSIRSLWESDTPVGRSQDSPSEGSSVDPSKAERNDHGLPGKGTSGGSHQTPQASRDELNLNPPRAAPRIAQQMPGTSNEPAAAHIQVSHGQQSMASRMTVTSTQQMSSPRRISISVCSSAYEHNVEGFMSKLNELQAGQPHMIADVSFRTLPYNDIDSFRFPSNDPVDVMVLCHSVHNRGYSITNVMNALYEKYLQYCHDVIGKMKLAVIVHDFSDCKPKSLDARMESIIRSQHLTFELVDTVIVCGRLEVPGKIEMRDEDMTRLTIFFEKARFQQKENTKSRVDRIRETIGSYI